MLETLRQRLLETSDAYPNAADIPSVSLTLNERRIVIDAEIHAAIRSAVPCPDACPRGRLSRCSLMTSPMSPSVATTITFGWSPRRRAPRARRGAAGERQRVGVDLPAQAPAGEDRSTRLDF